MSTTATSWSERRESQLHSRSKGSASSRETASLDRPKVRTSSGEKRAEVFRSWKRRFTAGALAENYGHLEPYWDELATTNDLDRTLLRFDTGFFRNIATEVFRVLIMLAKRRAQRLVLKVRRVSPSLSDVRTDLDGHDRLEAGGFLGNINQW